MTASALPVIDVAPLVAGGPGREAGGQHEVVRLERRTSPGPAEDGAAQHESPGHQRDRQASGIARGDPGARGVTADPFGGFPVEVLEQRRVTGVHGLCVRRVRAEREHLPRRRHAVQDGGGLAVHPGREPPQLSAGSG